MVKLQGALLKQTTGGKGGKEDHKKLQLSDDDRDLLEKLIKDKEDEKDNEDNLNGDNTQTYTS